MDPAAFQHLVYTEAKPVYRSLPWRDTEDPYHIWISELMLQQTQVARVLDKYREWLTTFPTVCSLANAGTQEVLRVWSGLGYNSRAIRARSAAHIIVDSYQGNLPRDYTALTNLPGVGSYTAGAILAFAWNEYVPILETNIRTVHIHHLVHTATVSDGELLALVDTYADKEHPKAWYTALMDYGTALKAAGVRTNARVKGYTKQSPFKGSVREARSLILRSVVEGGGIVLPKHPMAYEALQALVEEGLVTHRGGVVRLVE